ncbi:ABC transporter ATP-binding protein [Microbaculum marinisediminis]|uniref:ABC transporter ATP-binding protein n=1 Tax=Microbaculum marinisediminis TaxID=2931392 RepID=A0AAW5QUJ0_9HYPH|nr:ABC transporter ATP-binding protein [Microbaculum sp. A6E488]MCT8970632.1 ABC transporter ATP-binding protein [Microbaculum sp. A6E488]
MLGKGKNVVLDGVSMVFGTFTAVRKTDLEIGAGEFFSILGPSGCGKTTLLRMISGFLEPTTGRVLIGGDDMAGIGPNRRPTALIFQNLALFPLMPVWENVAFGLEARGMPKRKRRERAMELIDLVALRGQEDKLPGDLSGGQRQRVAIARALAVEPAVLLLDEPLSALDLKLRQHMRAELKSIQRKTGVTFVYITHDQGEALTMSDRIAVMNHGSVEQVDTTDVLYDNPATPFVATFVGEQNVFRGKVAEVAEGFAVVEGPDGRLRGRVREGLSKGDAAMVFVRPERMQFLNGAGLDNVVTARVDRRDLEGPFVNLFLKRDANEIMVHIVNSGAAGRDLDGEQRVGFAAADALVLPTGDLARD